MFTIRTLLYRYNNTKKETFKVSLTYFILGDVMGPKHSFFILIAILCICILIFYQIIITLILPLRFNIIVLLIETGILFFLLFKLLWPC